MTSAEWLRKNVSKYDTKEAAVEACIKATGITRDSVLRQYNLVSPRMKTVSGSKTFLTDKDVDEKYDSFYIISKFAKKLKKGEYFEDAMFREDICKLNVLEYRRPSLDPEFDIYKGKVGGKTLWSHPESIKARKMKGTFK